jgi:hypothetical protein
MTETDYGKLIEEARRGTKGYSEGDLRSLAKSLADAVEALVADMAEDRRALNDAIDVANRNKIDADAQHAQLAEWETYREQYTTAIDQLDSMTEEWGTAYGGLVISARVMEAEARGEVTNDGSLTLIRRLVSPWVAIGNRYE